MLFRDFLLFSQMAANALIFALGSLIRNGLVSGKKIYYPILGEGGGIRVDNF